MSLSPRQQELLEYMLANPMLPETVCEKNCGVTKSTWNKCYHFVEKVSMKQRSIF